MSAQTIARPEAQTRDFAVILAELERVNEESFHCLDGNWDAVTARQHALEQEARAAIRTALGVDFDTMQKVMG